MEIHAEPPRETVRALLDACGLPHDDLDEVELAHFLGCGPRARPLGVVGLEMLGKAALLRSLAVAEGARGRGCGAALLAAAERHAAARGVATLYLLTEGAGEFFRLRGWRALARDEAPAAVCATRQFSALCPDSALLMSRRLTQPAAADPDRAGARCGPRSRAASEPAPPPRAGSVCAMTTQAASRTASPDTESPVLAEVLAGLRARPRTLPCKLFYDEEGSRLYEQITALEEYYPFAAESEILGAQGEAIAEAIGRGVLVVEYGSGSSVKTCLLLDRLEAPAGYVPIDISREHLMESAEAIAARYRHIEVVPLHADFTAELRLPDAADRRAPRLAFFPGSTIGNFDHAAAERLLARIRALVGERGRLLVGVDLPKDRETLERAYDDSRGVTAAFNLNILAHLNRRFGADFDLGRFEHLARWNEAAGRVEMHLRCREDHAAQVAGERFDFAAGETLWTESCYKHDPQRFQALAARAGFAAGPVWFDAARRYSLHLLHAAG